MLQEESPTGNETIDEIIRMYQNVVSCIKVFFIFITYIVAEKISINGSLLKIEV